MHTLQNLTNLEKISAKLLLGATILALFFSNSFLHNYYDRFFHYTIFVHLGHIKLKSNLLFWINHGLMTIFFLVIGLEIKYEIMQGSLNSLRKAALPGISAIGGMIIPLLIYISFNVHNAITLRGWAIPTATDIAFASCILSLLGSKAPSNLKVFLIALAIFDDLAAIIIIAFFYSNHISIVFLDLSLICVFLLFILNKWDILSIWAYSVVGFALWICLLKSGVQETLAGVILALMIPLQNKNAPSYSPLQKIRHILHPWVFLIIIPLFAFANAGVSLLNLGTQNLHPTIILGILFGLFLGKQFGIFSASWIAVKLGVAALPDNVRWSELYATAIICGIGFTISLFIGSLAFNYRHTSYLNSVKIGVLTGSLLSGVIGYLFLQFIYRTSSKKYFRKISFNQK